MATDFRSRYQNKKNLRPNLGETTRSLASSDILIDGQSESDSSVSDLYIPASATLRLFAWLLDTALLAILIQGCAQILDIFGFLIYPDIVAIHLIKVFVSDTASLTTIPFFLTPIIWIIYILLLGALYGAIAEASPSRSTLGKSLLGIYVTDLTGLRCNFATTLLRNLAKILSILSLFIGCLLSFRNKDRQTFHDLISGCKVVKRLDFSETGRVIGIVAAFISIGVVSTYLIIDIRHRTLSTVAVATEALTQQTDLKDATPEAAPTTTPQATPTPVKEANEKVYGDIGTILVNGKGVPINGVFVRIMDDKKTASQRDFNQPSSTSIEVALFKELLTTTDKVKLESIRDLLTDTEEIIEKTPLARLVISYIPTTQYCRLSTIIDASIKFSPTLTAAIPQELTDIRIVKDFQLINPSRSFNTSCFALDVGQSFSMRMDDRVVYNRREVLKWNFRFSSVVARYKQLGSLSYTSAASAIALYDKSKSVLTIATFTKSLLRSDLNIIRSLKSVTTPSLENRPSLIATIPLQLPQIPKIDKPELAALLAKKRLNISRENIKEGYTITIFHNQKGKLKIGDKEIPDSSVIKYPAGQVPTSINGRLQTGASIVGRLSGEKTISMPEGIFSLDWNIPFNASVIEIN
ncbi:MAG: RDD family protein [Bdellovibrionota bacterium]|jgi:uncharacterized RDD family membrane protein YckC